MSSKYIDNDAYATSGYTLSGAFQGVTIGTSGSIGGPGLVGGGGEAYQIVNRGGIAGLANGIYLQDGGKVTNSGSAALIKGADGIHIVFGVGTVVNSGTIAGGAGTAAVGVLLSLGGVVDNTASAGLIKGYIGVEIVGAGSIANTGTIEAMGTTRSSAGIYLSNKSLSTNSIAITNSVGGMIDGYSGIVINYGTCLISNTGTIEATGDGSHSIGIAGADVNNTGLIESLGTGRYSAAISGGSVTNAANGRIEGEYAIRAADVTNMGYISGEIFLAGQFKLAVVDNTGTIIGAQIGVNLGFDDRNTEHDSSLTNSAGGVIEANYEAVVGGAVTNAGTIISTGDAVATAILVNEADGLVQAGSVAASGVVKNAGTIISTSKAANVAAINASELTNSAGALIEGQIGVAMYYLDSGDGFPTGTLTNYGTIASSLGASGTAVSFGAYGTLIDEAGSSFIGKVLGNSDATLELAGQQGTINFGTHFYSFGRVEVLKGADCDLVGPIIIASGDSFLFESGAIAAVAGTLMDAGLLADYATSTTKITASIRETGTITVADTATLALSGASNIFAGTIDGAGKVEFSGGKSALTAAATLTAAHLALVGSVTILDIGANLDYAGGFAESGGTLALPGAGETLTLIGAASFSGGTIAGDGTLAGDIVQLDGSTALSALTINRGAVLSDFGTVTATGNLSFGNAAGAGRLVVEAKDIFDITANNGISGTTGSVINDGIFEKTAGTGLSGVAPAFENNAEILVTAGTLDLTGAVSGTGQATIGSGGELEFGGKVAAGETISFASTAGGTLILDDPSGTGIGFAGTVHGFGKSNQLDLRTFVFSGKPTLAWKQNGSGGTLTVEDGSDIAKITLFGQYVVSGFALSSDGHSGTLISYNTPAKVDLAIAHH